MTRSWETHTAAAKAAIEKLDYRTGEAELRAALTEAEQFGATDRRLVETLRNLVSVQLRGYQSAELIEPFARRLLDLQKTVAGPESSEFILVLHLLAQTTVKGGKYQEAEALLRRALAIREKLTGPNALAIVGELHALGVRLWFNKRFAESEAVFQRTLDILRNNPRDPSTIGIDAVLDCLAMLYDQWGQAAKAEHVIQQRLQLADDRGDDDELMKASSFTRLAEAYREQRKYEPSERAYRTAIEHRTRWLRRTIGARRFRKPATAGTRASLRASMARQIGGLYQQRGSVLRELGRTREARHCEVLAERAFKRSLALEEERQKYGTDLAEALAALAQFYRARGNQATALPLYQRAIGLYRQSAETYAAPTRHAERSHIAIRKMFNAWADALEREAQEIAPHRPGE
jgi:tetratricopeptide (TPR) repeat protein